MKKSKYKVTGFMYNSNKRFKTIHTDNKMYAFGINLWKGAVWELQTNGKYKCIDRRY